MKKLIILIILLFASVAGASRITKIINWINNQNYTRTQLEGVTWSQMETMAENRGIDPNSIKPYARTILNSAHSYWRKNEIEKERIKIETWARQRDPDAIVLYLGQEPSPVDPNNILSAFKLMGDLNLERN